MHARNSVCPVTVNSFIIFSIMKKYYSTILKWTVLEPDGQF
jgi:hypothetical protein